MQESKTGPGWSLNKRDPNIIKKILPLLELQYKYYFCVKSDGWENIPNGKVLLAGSHNGGLGSPDLGMFMYDWFSHFGVERELYGLMHKMVWKFMPSVAESLEKFGAIVAHPIVANKAFKRGASVLVYPGGGKDVFRPFHLWNKIFFNGHKGFIKLALKEDVPIIPVISVGAHHTLIVLGDILPLLKELHKMGMPWPFGIEPEVAPIFLGSPWGVGIGPMPNIPWPTKIYIRICKPIELPKPKKRQKNLSSEREYVNECYDHITTIMQKELDKLIEESSY